MAIAILPPIGFFIPAALTIADSNTSASKKELKQLSSTTLFSSMPSKTSPTHTTGSAVIALLRWTTEGEVKRRGITTLLKKNWGLSMVLADICSAMVEDSPIWSDLEQFIQTVKPLIDVIRNLELQDTTLADCMLELICYTQTMNQLMLEEHKNPTFWLQRAAHMSISRLLHSRSQSSGTGHLNELLHYNRISKSIKNWTNLDAPSNKHLLKALAIVLHSIVLHAAKIEHVFSELGGIQSVKRCRLSVETFKLKAGINVNLAEDLEENFSWVPPMTVEGAIEELLDDPEDEAEVDVHEYGEVLTEEVYNFVELEKLDQGVVP
ncbi:hypothetical protein LXA43DRAFT_1067442 [Ganoderma leucocontextum]|nr:hypothetical protein LXA43DRAFT_1067442 [Ganoderma leucocontextum]